jgi:RNA polymerase sigma factor (sigma-70 family)
MKLDDKTYKKYLNFAKVIVKDDYLAQDILQESLYKLISKNYELTDNLVFITLRNEFNDQIKRENKYTELPMIENEYEEINESIVKIDNEFQNKLNVISDTYGKLNIFEQQLLYLVAVSKLTVSEIARQTQISRNIINYRFKKIKEKIQDEYEKLQEN